MTRLVFKVESHGRPYAVMVLERGRVTARINRMVLRGVFLAHALQWVKERNPRPATEPVVTIVGLRLPPIARGNKGGPEKRVAAQAAYAS